MKVEFTYGKGGKKVLMQRRYADTLSRLGHGTYETRMLTAAPPPPPARAHVTGPLVSKEVAEFAEENKVDLTAVIGTGKDGRIKKSDIEAVIAARIQE